MYRYKPSPRGNICTNREVNLQSVLNVGIPNSQNNSEFIGNDSDLSNYRSRSCLKQTLRERSINVERRRTQAAETVTQFRVRYREPKDDDEVVEFERLRRKRNNDNQRLLEQTINILQNDNVNEHYLGE